MTLIIWYTQRKLCKFICIAGKALNFFLICCTFVGIGQWLKLCLIWKQRAMFQFQMLKTDERFAFFEMETNGRKNLVPKTIETNLIERH